MQLGEQLFWFFFYSICVHIALFFLGFSFYDPSGEEEQHIEFHESYDTAQDHEIDEQQILQNIILSHTNTQQKKILQERLFESFIPTRFSEIFPTEHRDGIQAFFTQEDIGAMVEYVTLFHHSHLHGPRGQMKGGHIHLYGAEQLSPEEYLAVAIHEFAHYHDIHIFTSEEFQDISQIFYDISWDGIYDLKVGQGPSDFTSGYALTNKYEDFAEAYTFFILHQEAFQEKAKQSIFLAKKYDFFTKYIDVLSIPGISELADNTSYNWDTTKIPYNFEKFLQFFQNPIQ